MPSASQSAERSGWTFYIDANPLSERHLTGIGRYTARVALALAGEGAEVRFFSFRREIVPPRGLRWEQDQDLGQWGRQLWSGAIRPLGSLPERAAGLYTCLRLEERGFPFEISILHDFTPLIVPQTHSEQTRRDFQFFFGRTLLKADAALAVSHSTKADAGWLTDFPQARIVVAHSGPSLCVERHLRAAAPVCRRPEVGLVVSTLEPRKNADFLLDWFRQTRVLPPAAELWWVGSLGWLMSQKALRAAIRRSRRKVRLLGVVSDAKLCELYATAGWTVYPSLYEGFGFPVLDALRHGAPVLAGCHSSLREFRSPGLFFFDPRDAESLDDAWRKLEAAGPIAIPAEPLDGQFNWSRVARTLLALPETMREAAPRTKLGRSAVLVA
jgi:glycosyltransferase involved in cell wall biosynthesis